MELTIPRKPKQSFKDPQYWECDVINGGSRVARVSSPNDLEALRLANLFAAAPELLAACKAFVRAYMRDDVDCNKEGEKVRIMIQDAIAKAEGK